MPTSAMQKLMVRNGGMLSWGWLPPTVLSAAGDMATGDDGAA